MWFYICLSQGSCLCLFLFMFQVRVLFRFFDFGCHSTSAIFACKESSLRIGNDSLSVEYMGDKTY